MEKEIHHHHVETEGGGESMTMGLVLGIIIAVLVVIALIIYYKPGQNQEVEEPTKGTNIEFNIPNPLDNNNNNDSTNPAELEQSQNGLLNYN